MQFSSYVEQLENLHILMETRQILQAKLDLLNDGGLGAMQMKEDLQKIDQDIQEITNGNIGQGNTHSLFNPAIYMDPSELE